MSYIITAIVFILIFSILVLIHEFGHFIMARRAGMQVDEFGFGLPPRIFGWRKKKTGTLYSLNWIPFGGFVKIYGEDSLDPHFARSKKSFSGKPIRARFKVIVAGVVMNFILAWALLTFGFTAGMQPLLGPDDVFSAVDSGVINLIEGIKIKEIDENSLAKEIGLKPNDVIYEIDSSLVDSEGLQDMLKTPVHAYKVIREGEIFTYEVTEELYKEFPTGGLGITFDTFASFPRVKIYDVQKESPLYKAGIRSGDIIISVNGKSIFSVTDFEENTRGVSSLDYEIYKDGAREHFIVELPELRRVIISGVISDGPAATAGLKTNDIIVSVNGTKVTDSEKLIDFVKANQAGRSLAYVIERDGKNLFFEITPKDGQIGVWLSELMDYSKSQQISVYNSDVVSSVVEIKNVKYPFYYAPYEALKESLRLSKLTVVMFRNFVAGFVTSGEVPEGIAGPVGIAQLTHVFVQEGFIPLIRFIALLSLSLAVINILPFPALDGGRLLFLIFELIAGRKINQRFESLIHMAGYALLIILIFAVTYGDVARLIK